MDFKGVYRHITAKYPVRFNRDQKDVFLVYLSKLFTHAGYEEDEISIRKMHDTVDNNNLLIGDYKNSDIVVTSHFDTPARKGNFRKIISVIGKTAFMSVIMLLEAALTFLLIDIIINKYPEMAFGTKFIIAFVFFAVLLCVTFMIPALTANKQNVNATSGLFTMISLAQKVACDERLKGKVSFAVFDNTEWGMLGSSAYNKWCRKNGIGAKNRRYISIAETGSGDELVLITPNKKSDTAVKVKKLFEELDVKYTSSSGSLDVVADCSNLKNSVGIARASKTKVGTLYIPNKASKYDDTTDFENVEEAACILYDVLVSIVTGDTVKTWDSVAEPETTEEE